MSSHPNLWSPTARRVVTAMICGVLIYGLAMGTTYPLLGVVLSSVVSDSLNGLNAAATGLGLLTGVVLVPAACRALGSGGTALAGVGIMVVALTALSGLSDFWLIFAARALLGVGANFLFVIAETALNAFSPSTRRGRVMGFYTAATAIGFVLGPSVVALAPDAPVVLLVGCAAVTALALLPLASVRTPVTEAVAPSTAAAIIPTLTRCPGAYAFLFLASGIDGIVISLLPVIALRQGFDLQTGALFVALFHIGLVVGQPLIGLALDWAGRRLTVLGCCAVSMVAAGIMVFGAEIGMLAAGAVLTLWGASNYGLYTGGLALIGDRFTGAALVSATAGFAGVYALASLLSTPLAGLAADMIGASGLYGAGALIYGTALALGLARFRPPEPSLQAG